MLKIRCPQCQSTLAFDDEMSGKVVSCPDCAVSLRVPGTQQAIQAVAPLPRVESSTEAEAIVRLIGQPKWMLFEIPLQIVVDGERVGQGSVKSGFDLVVKLPAGAHKIEIGPAGHDIDIPRPGHYEVEFAYSKTWGKYSIKPEVRRLRADEVDDWPSEDDAELIDMRRREDGAVSRQDQAVLDELDQLQNQKSSWGGAATLLFVSLFLFVGAARAQDWWESILIIIPVLLFHELGHYVTMRAIGYRNLKMFFIPFFGAAVSGQHYNVAGWKKALVALAGPVPGIFLGAALGIAGLLVKEPLLIQIATMLLFVNGFNLLPFLPLDGGWVVHAVLFVRTPVMDVIFRVVAALCLLGLAFAWMSWWFGIIAVFMLLATPMAYRLARIAHQLGKEGLVTRSLDDYSIPDEAALRILAELRRFMPAATAPNILARNVATVFEAFNAEPPGVLASLGLLSLHAGSFVAALVTVIALFAGRFAAGG